MRNLIILLCLISFGCSYGQMRLKLADKHFDNLNINRAGELYASLAKKKNAPIRVIRRARDCYYDLMNYDKSLTFAESIKVKNLNDHIVLFHLYKLTNRYNDAIALSKQAVIEYPTVDLFKYNTTNEMNLLLKDSSSYTISPVKFNSLVADFSPAYLSNDSAEMIVFSSNRTKQFLTNIKDDYTGESYFDLYTWNKNDSLVVPFNKRVNSKYHDSPISFSNGGTRMYLTRSNLKSNKKAITDSLGHSNLKLYYADYVNGSWGDLKPFPFNSDNYSVGHASATENGKELFFISDKPGGKGKTDIYKTTWNGSSWSTPVNQEKINTSQKEMFPYIAKDGYLYFSSNGFNGLGGLDIYKTRLGSRGTYRFIKNLGYPINSSNDDFGFIIKDNEGFLSSNRNMNGKLGNDDIFKFVSTGEDLLSLHLVGNVQDAESYKPIDNVAIHISNLTTNKDTVLYSNASGEFEDFLTQDLRFESMEFKVELKKDGYFTKGFTIEKDVYDITEVVIDELLTLELIKTDIKEVSKVFKIADIYYDYDKSNIRQDASLELDKLINGMKEYKDLIIEIGSHTDCRGSKTYNETLSQARAQSAMDYVIKQGISADRIYGKGYGENKLLNDCFCEPSNTSDCTEEQHQQNRRTEFRVLKDVTNSVKIIKE